MSNECFQSPENSSLGTWNEAVLVGPGTTWDWMTFPVKARLSTSLEFWRLLVGAEGENGVKGGAVVGRRLAVQSKWA